MRCKMGDTCYIGHKIAFWRGHAQPRFVVLICQGFQAVQMSLVQQRKGCSGSKLGTLLFGTQGNKTARHEFAFCAPNPLTPHMHTTRRCGGFPLGRGKP